MMSTGPQIKSVIFDLGRVLIDFDHRISARKIAARSKMGEDEILKLFFDSPLTAAFEAGKTAPEEFFLQIKELLALRMGYEEFIPAWNEIFFFSEKNRQVYTLALKLKKQYKTALLSNVNILHFEYIKKAFPILDAFHEVIASFEVGCVKPSACIYNSALKLLETRPDETFYTDDREELILGARSLGIKGFTFKGIEQLKNDLQSLGVKL